MNEESPGRSRCGALLAVSAAALCLAAPAAAQDAGGQSSTSSGSSTPAPTTGPSPSSGPTPPPGTALPGSPSRSTTAATSAAYTPDPNPYYLGVGQGFTHDSNVYRIPSGPSDTYSSTTLFGGFDQPISRQRVFGRAGVSLNRYADETQLNNTSYDVSLGAELQTIEHISGNVNVGFSQNLAAVSTTFGAPSAGRNLETTQRAGGTLRWGGPSLLTLEGSVNYFSVDFSAPQFVTSESRETTASLALYYRPSPILRTGLAARFERRETPKAVLDPNSATYQSNSTDGNNLDLLVDYTPDSQLTVNARLSYTRETNSLITTSNFSGFTGRLLVNWQPTAKSTLVVDAARDTGFETSSVTRYSVVQSGTGLTLTPVSVVYQNNRITDTAGISAIYGATAKITASAGFRYTRAQLAAAVEAGVDARNVDVTKSATIAVNYAITRAWTANCTLARETRDVETLVSYSYTANVIGCATQFTWH